MNTETCTSEIIVCYSLNIFAFVSHKRQVGHLLKRAINYACLNSKLTNYLWFKLCSVFIFKHVKG